MLAPDPPESTGGLDLRSYIDVLLRRWRVVVGVVVVGIVVALGLSLRQDDQYQATSEVLFAPRTSNGVGNDSLSVYAESFNVARRLTNNVEKLTSQVTVDAVAAKYKGPLDPADVTASVSASTSDVVKVKAVGSDPKEVAELVNTYVSTFVELQRSQHIEDLLSAGEDLQNQIDDLTRRIDSIRSPLTEVEQQLAANPGSDVLEARRDDLTSSLESQLAPLETQRTYFQGQLESLQVSANIAQSGGPELLSEADVPTDPIAPKPIRNALLAVVVGLLLGVAAAFLFDSLDERIRNVEDLAKAAPGVPPFAVVPEDREARRGYVAMRDDGRSAVAESFRSLRTSVKFAGLDAPLRVIQITSALPGEGKTTVVANLAEAFAQAGERVVVVCCDMRRPRIHEYFRQAPAPGFTDVLLGNASLSAVLRPVSERLHVLPAGVVPPNPSELLSSSRAAAVIAALADEYPVVLIDSTPVVPVTDALVVSRLVDATIVVTDVRRTNRRLLRQTVERLRQVSAPVIGLVLNGVRSSDTYHYGYGYGYGYSEPEESNTASRPPALPVPR